MTPLLYKIPETLLAGYHAQQYHLVGATLKDVATGQIVGHVQQTGVLDTIIGSALKGVQSTASDGFSPLGFVSVVQNEQIKGSLRQMQGTLGLLQNLQIGTLAVSGLGLGVSVIGFAMMLKRLKAIESHIEALGAKIDQITKDRRGDDLKTIFADIGSDLDIVDTLASREDPKRVAEHAQMSLARNAGRLEVHFARQADLTKRATISDDDLEMVWSLAAAIRLCHEAGVKALLVIDETGAAEQLADKQAMRFLELSQPLSPDALARLASRANSDPMEAAALRRAALPQARTLVTAIRDAVASISSQSDLAGLLRRKGVAGPDYLRAVEQEDKEALLFLPA